MRPRFLLVTLAIAALLSNSPAPGELASPEGPQPSADNHFEANEVPPFIDAMDGIAPDGTPFPLDPTTWNRSAPINERNTSSGVTEARIKLRMEGKGDPIRVSFPQQTVLVADNSAAIAVSDPSSMRCDGQRTYLDQVTVPDEISVVSFNGSGSLDGPLSTDFQGMKQLVRCFASGAANLSDGLRIGLDELIPKKKESYRWSMIVLTGGCRDSNRDTAG
ncbi:MAG TPA: hypothetical protein VI893_02935, partial [Thermoplasmata archaeon]|nr:hypothetical protein [Thermoplasmata archaeon]